MSDLLLESKLNLCTSPGALLADTAISAQGRPFLQSKSQYARHDQGSCQSHGLKWRHHLERCWVVVSLIQCFRRRLNLHSSRGAILNAQNSLDTNLGNMVTTWEKAIDTYNQQLFNGSQSSIDMLHAQITEGHVLEAGFQEDGIQAAMDKAIYGFLIPQAWKLSNKDLNPVVMYVYYSFEP